jgi:alkaline phosphatase
MPPNEPLFASDIRGSSIHSDERAAEEDTALLGSQRKDEPAPQSRARFWRELGLFTWAIVATAAVIVLAVVSQHQASKDSKKATPTGKRNLIFMVSDGMGPASLSMTRSFRQFEGIFHFLVV